MPNIFSLIGTSWELYRSQPVLNIVLFWLMVLPMCIMNALGMLEEEYSYFSHMWHEGNSGALFVVLAIYLGCTLLVVWGTSCILVIGKKLLKSKAGRTRSSFGTLKNQGRKYILPIFLTGLLQQCHIILLGLLFIIPGLIYAIRSFFYQIVIIADGLEGRDALKKSIETVKGHSWKVLWYILGLTLVLFLPTSYLNNFIFTTLTDFDARFLPITIVVTSVMYSITSMLFTLSSISLYAAVKKLK